MIINRKLKVRIQNKKKINFNVFRTMYMPSPMKNVMVNSYDQVHDDEEGKEIEGCLKHAPSLMCKFISFA